MVLKTIESKSDVTPKYRLHQLCHLVLVLMPHGGAGINLGHHVMVRVALYAQLGVCLLVLVH